MAAATTDAVKNAATAGKPSGISTDGTVNHIQGVATAAACIENTSTGTKIAAHSAISQRHRARAKALTVNAAAGDVARVAGKNAVGHIDRAALTEDAAALASEVILQCDIRKVKRVAAVVENAAARPV